ncbi:MAG TPA: hypothetical protein VLU41_02985, partial [Ideonella sp.]|nr:hypothetical protein [Ideonella sp.]
CRCRCGSGVVAPAFSGPRSRAGAAACAGRAFNTGVPRGQPGDREWGLRPQAPPPPCNARW